MLSLMPFTPRYAIFYAVYPKLCYRLCHIPRSSAIFFLNVMLQYITLTPSYANSSCAMFSGQSRGRISGYCTNKLTNNLLLRILRLAFLATWQGENSRIPMERLIQVIIYHSAVSPLENTNWINAIFQMSPVIGLIWWLK